jgi:hypothetical protein
MDDLVNAQTSYMTDKVAIVFMQEPTLQAIEEARKLLNDITDDLIKRDLK